jgi:hypothetical protein
VVSYLRLYKHQINKQNHIIMLNIFVGEPLAARTLRQTHPFAERAIIGFAIRRV